MVESMLEVSVGKPRTISMTEPGAAGANPALFGGAVFPFHWCPRSPLRLRDGSILLNFHVAPDITGLESNLTFRYTAYLRSLDGGTNWYFEGYSNPYEEGDRIQLDDGTVLGLSYGCYVKTSGEIFRYIYKSYDNGRTFERPFAAPIHFPEELQIPLSVFEGEGKWGRLTYRPGRWDSGIRFSRAPIQLPNGELLAVTGTCRLKDDTRDRCVLFKSTDRGESWTYLSTVAYDPEVGSEDEGFTESSIVRLPNGELFCMMRTGSGFPMYQCMSKDNGRTWSKPVSTGVVGVDPELVVMSNGVLACSYGRVLPRKEGMAYFSVGNRVMFSLNGGRTWSEPTSIYEGPSSGYTGIEEREPGELLYVYDIQGYDMWGSVNRIQAVNIKVKRKD